MKVVTIFLKFDYGIESRGESLEKKLFLPAIKQNADEVVSFWIEENGYPNKLDKLQEYVLEFAEKENPDIIFFLLMKDEIKVETLSELSKKYITINWFADDQWRFESFTRFIAPSLTYSVTTDKYSLTKYSKLGCKAILSQWAAMEYVESLNFNDIKYKYDISFIGGKNITREWFIDELRKSGYHVECFGSGWKNGKVTYEQMMEIFFLSKINLNLSNSIPMDIRFFRYLIKNLFLFNHETFKGYLQKLKASLRILLIGNHNKNIEQMKARNFEISGFGGFQLSQYALSLEDYYCIGIEIGVFSNIKELELQIKYYLENEEARKVIAINAYKRTIDYTYPIRIQKIFKEVNNG